MSACVCVCFPKLEYLSYTHPTQCVDVIMLCCSSFVFFISEISLLFDVFFPLFLFIYSPKVFQVFGVANIWCHLMLPKAAHTTAHFFYSKIHLYLFCLLVLIYSFIHLLTHIHTNTMSSNFCTVISGLLQSIQTVQ